MKILRGTPPNPRVVGDKSPLKKKPRRTPPSGPGVRQLHQRRLTQSRVRGGPRQGPAPDRPLRLALTASAILTVGTIFGAAIFHVFLIQSEFRLDQINNYTVKVRFADDLEAAIKVWVAPDAESKTAIDTYRKSREAEPAPASPFERSV